MTSNTQKAASCTCEEEVEGGVSVSCQMTMTSKTQKAASCTCGEEGGREGGRGKGTMREGGSEVGGCPHLLPSRLSP